MLEMLKKCSRRHSCAKPMSLKGEKLGTCGLEGIRRPPVEPSEIGLELDTWLGLLNLTSWGSKS